MLNYARDYELSPTLSVDGLGPDNFERFGGLLQLLGPVPLFSLCECVTPKRKELG